jgi:basic membrane lipoprotein Med (substrate-binding protein (PBP1-ABC) superfamily)
MTALPLRSRLRALFAFAAAVVAAPLLVPAPAEAQQPLKAAIVLPGPISDNDFNAGGYNGLKAAGEALGVEIAYSERTPPADAERVMRDYASRGYGLIFAHSFSYGDAALAVAEDFPDVKFMIAIGQTVKDNVGAYFNPDYQGAYLTGMLAAGASKTGAIGWVGGNPAPNMNANFNAWKAGAQEVNPDIKVMQSWLGVWFDPPKAKEAAIAQVEQGADVLSAQSVGVIDAAVEKKVLVFGAVSDQNHMGPQSVLTSILWNLAPVFTAATKTVVDGKWEAKNWIYGIKEGSITLADYHGLDVNVRPEVLQAVQTKFDDIKNGRFEVPLNTTLVK